MENQTKSIESIEVRVHCVPVLVLTSGSVHAYGLFRMHELPGSMAVESMPEDTLVWHEGEPYLTKKGLKEHRCRNHYKARDLYRDGMLAISQVSGGE